MKKCDKSLKKTIRKWLVVFQVKALMLKRLNLEVGTNNTECRVSVSEITIVSERVTSIRVPSGNVTVVLVIGCVVENMFKLEHTWQLAPVSMIQVFCEKVRLFMIPAEAIKLEGLRGVPEVEG